MTRLLAGVFLLAAIVASPALAQDAAPPSRNANIYDGRAHEPSAPSVDQAEKHDGVLPSQAQEQRENREVEQLGKKLLQETPR